MSLYILANMENNVLHNCQRFKSFKSGEDANAIIYVITAFQIYSKK